MVLPSQAFIALSILIGQQALPAAAGLSEINPPAAPNPVQTIAVVGARLIDGLGGPPIEDATVLLRGSEIVSVGPRNQTALPDDAILFDGRGFSILPGLVDSHLHTINDLEIPALFLAHGVTSFRDPGHPFRFYQAVLQTDQPMPRVFLCGSHLDAYPPIWPQQAVIIQNADQARRTVEQHVSRGASAIKIYFRLPLDLFATICSAADRHGIPVTAHLELVDADRAIEAGLDAVEHVTSFGTTLADRSAAEAFKVSISDQPATRRDLRYRLWAALDLGNRERVDPLVNLIVERNVVVSPTLAVFERRPGDRDVTEVHTRGFQNMLRFVAICHERGATVVPGSHTWVPHAKTGWAYQRELELLVEAGMTPLEAITSATSKNARFLGAEDRIGSLTPGKLADLILVRGNPAKDIRAMYDVEHVMLHGDWVTQPPETKPVGE